MQAETLNMDANTLPNLRDLRGLNITEMLNNMPIGSSKYDGYEIELEKVASIRSLLSQLHKSTELRFETAKTDKGIIIWRLK